MEGPQRGEAGRRGSMDGPERAGRRGEARGSGRMEGPSNIGVGLCRCVVVLNTAKNEDKMKPIKA